MSSPIKKSIIETLDSLPEESLSEVASFLSQLRAKTLPGAVGNESRRPYGLCAGEFRVTEAFDEPLPDDLLEAFEGR